MTDSIIPEVSSQKPDDVGQPTVWLSFCPEFGLYHIHHEVDGIPVREWIRLRHDHCGLPVRL